MKNINAMRRIEFLLLVSIASKKLMCSGITDQCAASAGHAGPAGKQDQNCTLTAAFSSSGAWKYGFGLKPKGPASRLFGKTWSAFPYSRTASL